jgi:pilin isopeptide linkage protein
MKKNNTFKKWMALFLSVAMIAVSGVTTNLSLRAAEDTGIQETGTTAESSAASSSASAGTSGQDGTTRTEEITLDNNGQGAAGNKAAGAETGTAAEEAEQSAQENTSDTKGAAADPAAGTSGTSGTDTSASGTASVSSSSAAAESDEIPSEEEQISQALTDATKRTYTYEDQNISVKAELDDADAIPDDAEFRVTPVTKDSTGYDYNAYMAALNNQDEDKQYTDENTLLYDMAFLYSVDVKDDQGNVTKKEVEVQPAEGAVKITVNFKQDQLTDSLDAEKNSDVEIKHLPLTDTVKDSTDTTADATGISASDIRVEDVKNTDVSVDSQTADFKTDTFSVFSFNNGQPDSQYCWNYKDGEGTTYTYRQVIDAINKGDNATNYAIYANSLIFRDHLEGNVKVGTMDIVGGGPLNQDSAVIQRNAVTKVQVNKTVDPVSDKDQTFSFASYDSNNNPIETFTITVKANASGGSAVLDGSSKTVEKLKTENVSIYELDKSGKPVQNGGNNGDYVVAYSNNTVTSSNFLGNYENYIGTINQKISWNLEPNFFNGGRKGVSTYIENLNGGHWEGNNYVFTSGSTVTVQNYHNDDPELNYIQQKDGITQTVADHLNYLKTVSANLADAHMGAVSGEGSLSVLNIKATPSNTGTSNLQNDLNKVLTWVQNGAGIKETIKENGYLLINIDATGCSNYQLDKFVIDGYDPDNNNEEFARHVIYNIVQKDSSGKYVAYDKTVSVAGVTGGLVLAPAARYDNTEGLRGEVIANVCNRNADYGSSGAEIHKDSHTTQTTAQVNVSNTKSSHQASGEVTLEGTKKLTGRTLKDKEFNFVVKDESGNTVSNGTNDADGKITFAPITYTQDEVGSHTYTVSEAIGKDSSITYDSATYKVTVAVTDNGDGTLSATPTYPEGRITFTNSYKAKAASAVISGTKTVNGKVPGQAAAGQFRFNLIENTKVIDTASNDASGKYVFGRIYYKEAGTYKYQIQEQNAGQTVGGIQYPDEVRTVKVIVTDDGTGQLKAETSAAAAIDNKQYASLTVRKDWEDDNNAAGYRPSAVVVDLIDKKTDSTVQKAELSELNNWTAVFDLLEPDGQYIIHEETDDIDAYTAENNDQPVTADVNGRTVTLTNRFTHPAVTVYANKVLRGGTLSSGEFTFALYRNSEPDKLVKTAVNNAAGEIFFTGIKYDEKGYTVREIAGDDQSIAYDDKAVTYDAEGRVTGSSHTEFVNTQRPIVLRVQKRSKVSPYDPLVGATYGLYLVTSGGNDVLVESQTSDKNGYMYFGRIEASTDAEAYTYYFKEISAPEGHEVDPYAGQKFQVRYTGNGKIALFAEDGKTKIAVEDITTSDENLLPVQHISEKTELDTNTTLKYSDDKIEARAEAEPGAFADGTTLKVVQLTDKEAAAEQSKVEAAVGEIDKHVVYYGVEFLQPDGQSAEPAFGDVTVTIQYKGSLDMPEGTDPEALKIVHLKDEKNGETEVQAVAGSIATASDQLLQTSFTADSFSVFGIVEPSDNSSLNSNYLVTAAGVSDKVSELKIAKLDTSGKYVKGARLQILEKATGTVVADWTTTDRSESFARWFDKAKSVSVDVDKYYILHEVSAPDGYQLADDILFKLNPYDSSIIV